MNADKTIGGMPNRFVMLWNYLYNKRKNNSVFLLTTYTLWDKLFGASKRNSNAWLFNDTKKISKFFKLFLWIRIIVFCKLNKIQTIHIAGGGKLFIPLLYFSHFIGIKVVVTFASNSLEMASYSNKKEENFWRIILRITKNVDVLNPTHDLPTYNYRKFVSPCSFPYILENPKSPTTDFLSKDRKEFVVFNGSFASSKNPILAINGFERYLENNRKKNNLATLIMFGNGALSDKVNERIVEINAKFGNEFIKRENYAKLHDVLKSSLVFLSLQDFDNYPSQSLMEAMLYCNSIIATNFGDTRKLVKVENNNYLIEKDEYKLANAIEQALKLNSLNKNNHFEIINNHNIAKFSEYFLNIHKNLK